MKSLKKLEITSAKKLEGTDKFFKQITDLSLKQLSLYKELDKLYKGYRAKKI